jgi:hypothetical protein
MVTLVAANGGPRNPVKIGITGGKTLGLGPNGRRVQAVASLKNVPRALAGYSGGWRTDIPFEGGQ